MDGLAWRHLPASGLALLMEPMKPKKSNTTSQSPTRRRKPDFQPPSVSENTHERIAKRAYEIYERRIRQSAFDDWLQAEQEILKEKRSKRKTD